MPIRSPTSTTRMAGQRQVRKGQRFLQEKPFVRPAEQLSESGDWT